VAASSRAAGEEGCHSRPSAASLSPAMRPTLHGEICAATAILCPSFLPNTFISSLKTWEGMITVPRLSSNTWRWASAVLWFAPLRPEGVLPSLASAIPPTAAPCRLARRWAGARSVLPPLAHALCVLEPRCSLPASARYRVKGYSRDKNHV
jgi:hypothetical protein